MEWIKIASANELDNDEAKTVRAGSVPLALFRIENEFFAIDGMCTHGKALLSEGYVEDGCVECPLHQGRFDIRTGKAMCAPATVDLRTFDVRREGDDLYVRLPSET
jgi:NAD(P)H-dependent nitrite reductase small subunit